MVRHYPLESLGTARGLARERRAQELKRQVQRTEKAATAAASARAAHQRRLEANRAVELEEQSRLSEGEARAGDLMATAAWRSSAERQAAASVQQAQKAERQLSEEVRAERTARGSLSSAEADAKAVAKHRARWHENEEAHAAVLAEDEAGDVWLSRHRRAGNKRDKGP